MSLLLVLPDHKHVPAILYIPLVFEELAAFEAGHWYHRFYLGGALGYELTFNFLEQHRPDAPAATSGVYSMVAHPSMPAVQESNDGAYYGAIELGNQAQVRVVLRHALYRGPLEGFSNRHFAQVPQAPGLFIVSHGKLADVHFCVRPASPARVRVGFGPGVDCPLSSRLRYQMFHRFALLRMNQLGGDLGERHQHESALLQAGVRY